MSSGGIHPQVRVVVKPYASALPLGFFAFAIGMFLLAAQGAEWVPATQVKTIGLLLFAFVSPLELLAAVIAFVARDTLAAAALGLFGTSWLASGLVLYQAQPGMLSPALGYFEVAFAIVVVCLGIVAVLGKPLIAAILVVSAGRAALAAAYELGAGSGVGRVAGWLGLAIFVAAIYGGLAFLLEDVTGKSVLTVWRKGASREAVEGDLSAQLGRLESEAGVRRAF